MLIFVVFFGNIEFFHFKNFYSITYNFKLIAKMLNDIIRITSAISIYNFERLKYYFSKIHVIIF